MTCENCAEDVAKAQAKRTKQLREHQAKLVAADAANRAGSGPSQEEIVRAAQKDVKPDAAVEPKAEKRATVEVEGPVVEPEPEPVEVEAVEPDPEPEPEKAADPEPESETKVAPKAAAKTSKTRVADSN